MVMASEEGDDQKTQFRGRAQCSRLLHGGWKGKFALGTISVCGRKLAQNRDTQWRPKMLKLGDLEDNMQGASGP